MKKFQVDTNGTLTTNLVSYYKLEGNSNDFYGSNNGTDTSVSYGASYGKVGQGGSFNGSSSKIAYSIRGLSGTTFSISAWVYFANAGDWTSAGGIISETVSGDNNPYVELVFAGSAQQPQIWIINRNASAVGLAKGINISISAGNWYHVVWTCTTTHSNLYLNNSLIDSTSFTANSFSANRSHIGATERAATTYFRGYIDEVGIWNKVLSSQEISDLYNGGAGQTMIEVLGAARRGLLMSM